MPILCGSELSAHHPFMERAIRSHIAGRELTCRRNGSLANIETGWNNLSPVGAGPKPRRGCSSIQRTASGARIDATNHHPFAQSVEIAYGKRDSVAALRRVSARRLSSTPTKGSANCFRTPTHVPATAIGLSRGIHERSGFVHSLTYDRSEAHPHFPSRSERAIRR